MYPNYCNYNNEAQSSRFVHKSVIAAFNMNALRRARADVHIFCIYYLKFDMFIKKKLLYDLK